MPVRPNRREAKNGFDSWPGFRGWAARTEKDPRPGQPPEGTVTARQFAEKNGDFKAACKAADVKPTKRQAAKFLRGEGRAYGAR